uniref:ATP synthase F0 subunit 8 n=1 Tax=Malayopython reticulatus TaxID=1496311 RepID=A0A4D6E6H3_MALRE|nr:ATP synthase F0 subunit 8 [Malayopython reticulatus]QBZ73745.1 ATP synthase F0 subunit 8 [Malayopython reticulatus]
MPQLDIVYIFTNYIWTWFILISLTWKIKTTLFTEGLTEDDSLEELKAELTWILPWT